ncbi:MAG: hypothetical protein L0Y60_10845 [Beijerinckiaceae bacterium]|nr:hypothetical protein [Beijerinckiaceae bacterium]
MSRVPHLSGRDFEPQICSTPIVTTPADLLPAELAATHAMILAQLEMLVEAQAHAKLLASGVKLKALEIE